MMDAGATAAIGTRVGVAQPVLARDGRAVRVLSLAAFILVASRSVQFFPGMALVHEGWFALGLAFVTLYYLPGRFVKKSDGSPYETYLLAVLAVVPVLGSVVALVVWGQPLLYGFLAHRGLGSAVAAPIAVMMLGKRDRARADDWERAFLLLAWTTLVAYTVMGHVLDSEAFTGEDVGFVSEDGKFKFDTTFIVFGFFYYAFKGVRTASARQYLAAVPFLAYFVFEFPGRSLLLALAITFVVFPCMWGRRANLPAYAVATGLIVTCAWAALSQLAPALYAQLIDKFSSAFAVVLQGEMTDDASANARLLEAAMILPDLGKWWITGTGVISSQWGGGYRGALGSYFHPSDLGVLGVIYLYGAFGAVAFAAQYGFAVTYARRLRKAAVQSPFLDGISGLLLFGAFRSIATGQFAFYPEASFMLVALLFCAQRDPGRWHRDPVAAPDPGSDGETADVNPASPGGLEQ